MALQQGPAAAANNAPDPASQATDRLREAFIKELQHFHDTRGTPFKKIPKVSGKDVDLHKLYTVVTSRGGWIQVNSKNEWAWLCEEFHLPSGCVNSGVGLKQIYLRYLDRYEKVHFLGEDGHQADDDDEDSRHRKWNARSLHSVPHTYNHHQHNVAESLREYNGLSSNMYKPSNYDKLALSLLSPLPNEHDFAINVCTILSTEGKHTLRLDQYPRLVNHLLAHAGVYDSPGTRQLFIEVYSRVRNYSINSFWQDVLESQDMLDLTDERAFAQRPATQARQKFVRRRFCDRERERDKSPEVQLAIALDDDEPMDTVDDYNGFKDQNQNSIKFEDDDRDLFCVGRTLGTQDPFGQRVLQIASILRNLSFTPENAAILAKSRSFLRFVLLCVRSRWSNLHQLGFDTLGNIANEIVLKEAGERITNLILACVTKGVDSPDRFIVISSLEILNKISQQDLNEETLSLGLDDCVYDMICRFLALSDIALLVYTLECLYALTSLGERPCTSVARVRGAIDTLVALVTVEAQSYGPKACILMRVVETVSAIPASQQQQQQQQQQQPQQQQTSPASTTAAGAHSTPAQQTTPVAASPAVQPTVQQAPTVAQVQPVQVQQAQVVQQPVAVKVQVQQPQPAQQVQAAQPQTTPVKVVTTTASKPATPKGAAAKAALAATSLATAHTHQQIIQENEQFALGWLRATFEPATGVKIEQDELYKKYFGCCTKIGRKGVIAPLHFPRCVRNVFGGSVGPNHMKGESSGPLFYEGIKIRENPGQVTYPSQQIAAASPASLANNSPMKVQLQQRNEPNTNTTVTPSSPILKAQLSAPPKPNTTPSSPLSINAPSPATSYEPKTQVSSTHPHLSQALLGGGGANSSSQQQQQQSSSQQQQQQQVQVIVKGSNGATATAAATSSSIIKSLLATKVTVGGECMTSAAGATSSIPCVQQPAVTNATGVISSISANQLLTANQVAQRQQQQQQQRQQQQITVVQAPTKTPVNAKAKPTTIAVKKVQRLNGAKIIVANNCEKVDTPDSDTQTQLAVASITTDSNHVTGVIRKPNQSPHQRNVCTPVGEDSDSTNNSLASSSGIGGSRDCSGVGAEEENSLTSFEGILLNGAPGNPDIDAQDDGSSKDSSSVSSKEKPLQTMMLADLLERKMDKEPVLNGILGKKDLVENHIKKVLKESPSDIKIKAEVSEDALIEAPARVGIKRSASTDTEGAVDSKKLKYSNGTSSPDPATTTLPSVKSEEPEEEKDEKVSSTAANLYAALAADIIDDETDLEEPMVPKEEPKPIVKEEAPTPVKIEPTPAPAPPITNQVVVTPEQPQPQIQQRVQVPTTQPQTIAITQQQLQQSGLIMGPRQIVVQQTIQPNNQIVTIPAAALKGRTPQMQPQVLQVQQGSGGQTHYVISGGVGGQNYVLAQPQTALVQGQAQTVLVAQQQGTNTKTIIILQPQAAAQAQPQKVVAVTPQGQQVVVTQVPRPQLLSSSIGSIPPPLVPTSASIVVNQAAAATTQIQSQPPSQGTITVVQAPQTTAAVSAVPVRVVTPTPAATPPTSRPTTPQVITQPKALTSQPASPALEQAKENKVAENDTSSNSSSNAANSGKQTTSHETATTTTATNTTGTAASASTTTTSSTTTSTTNTTPGPKTITIKMNPKAFLCEWRGCLKQFKTPRKVYLHAIETHCPTGDEEALCLWASCDGLKRRRFSLMTHLFDRHCMESVMLMRRKQLTSSEKTEVPVAPPPPPITPQQQQQHPGYAPNAAFHAIKRHALEFVNPKELMQRPSKPAATTTSSSSPRPGQNPPPEQDDNEGPVTKSIRLTAALILRNLVIYSAHGRRHLRAYEPHLAGVALSNVESSRTIAQVLYDMNDQSSSGHR